MGVVKGPEIQNVKLFVKHDHRPNLLKNGKQTTILNSLKKTTTGLQVPGLGQDT